MSDKQPFEWHGYKFELIELDIHEGSVCVMEPEYVAVWQVTRHGKRVPGDWTADVEQAKAQVLKNLRAQVIDLKQRLAEAENLSATMLAELHG